MNPATFAAAVIVDEFVRCGVREAVLAPGSRNAPLAFALYDADAAGRLRLHVRIDERSAAFLALGLAKASGAPVVVTCTSGTAAANFFPAVVEADASAVPLVALTADRPPELRGVGANQTIDQVKLYGDAIRLFVDCAVPGTLASEMPYWRTVVDRAIAAASGPLGGDPGPVHLNLPFREPLVPDGDPVDLGGRADGHPWTAIDSCCGRLTALEGSQTATTAGRVLVVAGDGAPGFDAGHAPVIAEPSSNARRGPTCLTAGTLLLGVPGLLDRMTPERVHVVGRPTLSRAVQRLLGDERVAVHVHPRGPRWSDPARTAATVAVTSAPHEPEAEWLDWWQRADAAARVAVDEWVDAHPRLSGLQVARDLAQTLSDDALLFVGSSQPIRDLDLAAGPIAGRVLATRGAAGIDGTISAAIGAALAHHGPAYALVGDLTFLHDANGLILGPDEPCPDLTIVVVDNDGGGIFALLEQGAPTHRGAFERIFGTPHGTDLAALCAATRTSYLRIETASGLSEALRPQPGLRVLHVPVDRGNIRDEYADLRERVAEAVARLP